MHFPALAVTLAGLALVSASPIELIEERNPSVGVKLCTDVKGQGTCGQYTAEVGICQTLTGALKNSVSSLYIYPSGYRCGFYINGGCQGRNIIYQAGPVDYIQSDFNDDIESFACGTA